jgi:hypothetical protein
MRKFYIAYSFTHAPKDFLDEMANLKEQLKKEYEILDFLDLEKNNPTSTAADVYKWDVKKCVAMCDMFVAICDHPAIGLGYELATALEKYSKPTLGIVKEGTKLTRLVEGIDHPMYTFKRYSTTEDIVNAIKEKELKHFKPVIVEVCETDVCAV